MHAYACVSRLLACASVTNGKYTCVLVHYFGRYMHNCGQCRMWSMCVRAGDNLMCKHVSLAYLPLDSRVKPEKPEEVNMHVGIHI